MTLSRLLAPALLAVALALPAVAAPLPLADFVRLGHEGVGEAVLLSLAQNQGVTGPLSADEVLEMSRAGWSDELMVAVVKAAAHESALLAAEPVELRGESVVYEERDGALVARLHGEPEPAPVPRPALIAAAPAPQVVVVQAPAAPLAAPAPALAPAAEYANGYPVGANHAWQGSTVFLPARFGGSTPSAFGRAIVSTGGSGHYGYGVPYAAPLSPYGYGGQVLVGPQRSTTLIRTSRGTRRIPN